MKKVTFGLIVCIVMSSGIDAQAHDLPSAGSESKGWKYVGAHWSGTSTKYFEATSDTWEARFLKGVNKFEKESDDKFSISKVSVGKSENFIESYSSKSATWVARRTFYSTSKDHPQRWRIQFNSAKEAESWTTVSAHEIGHVFGLADLYEEKNNGKLMFGEDNGTRTMQKSDKTGFNYIY
ncbi:MULTISPECIES: matrixin family metalloprotease [Exiguobacterium]|uniref:matrixin family metalloprotease n=1 Tax=Exiguobacterium TaxID=33986 RepID=UPI001BE5B124|nr:MULTISPECIES: matrixin family metalloprotease [Exiguobacterium]MCT4793577.1 matrixin family metalloprotease [Exiguobacterium artemiae]